jgi:hypothetical protein
MDYVGICHTVNEPQKSRNIHGDRDIKLISNTALFVVERNEWGDCLCMLGNIGLVDIDHTDVKSYTEIPNKADVLSILKELCKQ